MGARSLISLMYKAKIALLILEPLIITEPLSLGISTKPGKDTQLEEVRRAKWGYCTVSTSWLEVFLFY